MKNLCQTWSCNGGKSALAYIFLTSLRKTNSLMFGQTELHLVARSFDMYHEVFFKELLFNIPIRSFGNHSYINHYITSDDYWSKELAGKAIRSCELSNRLRWGIAPSFNISSHSSDNHAKIQSLNYFRPLLKQGIGRKSYTKQWTVKSAEVGHSAFFRYFINFFW